MYVILCDGSADRVLEDNINEKNNSSELAIDGRLLGEKAEEKSISALLQEALADFNRDGVGESPDESELEKTWPDLRDQLEDAARKRRANSSRELPAVSAPVAPPTLDWSAFNIIPFPVAVARSQPAAWPSWRRARL